MEDEYRGNAKPQLGIGSAKHRLGIGSAKHRLGTGSAKLQLGNNGRGCRKPSWSLAFPVE